MDFKAFVEASKEREEKKDVKFKRIKEPFTIRTISEEENQALRKQFTSYKKNKNGVDVPELDTQRYQRELAAAAVVNPPLDDAEFQAALGTIGKVETLAKILRAGEYNTLVEAILDFSGFNEDLEDVKNEIKKG